ncbi:hypothetical protein NP493_1558g00046 [Ridgeia piscesae]|uniref:Coiled-coil domain-containing protein 171 n=1 Tax=Ridgeia piscesae TaxID=27915 RepID=A0AAD9NB94_RIDPI|nr:hypothetical protein NP493_1558g00046 [Ridgeia piscesae]
MTQMTPGGSVPPTPGDISLVRDENRMLRARLRQLQDDLQAEQDTVSSLRKRLNAGERERLDNMAKTSDEVSRLDSTVARLRAQLERGEAVRQNHEFEMAKLNRQLAQERRRAAEREAAMADANDMLRQKIVELSHQVEQLCTEIEALKTNTNQEQRQLGDLLEMKEKALLSCQEEQELVVAEREKLEVVVQQRDNTIAELSARIQDLEGEQVEVGDVLRKQIQEKDLLKEREERLKTELEIASKRILCLEENIEAERAAHLESKFNSEIVQLRIRDLEGALKMERTAKAEIVAHSEKVNQQIRELQQVYDDERRCSKKTKDQMEKTLKPILRAEKEYVTLSNQLQAELEEKKTLIGSLSEQLDLHQHNFDQLKQELNKAKKRQSAIEETYQGAMRDLDHLLVSFQINDSKKRKKKETVTVTPVKPLPPSVLITGLRTLLTDYKRCLNDTTTEMKQLTAQKDLLVKESGQYQHKASDKDKTAQVAQQSLAQKSKELRKAQGDYQQATSHIEQLQAQLSNTQQRLTAAKEKKQQLEEQMAKVADKCKADEQTSVDFLLTVHHQLQQAHKMAAPSSLPAPSSPPTPCHASVAALVTKELGAVVTALQEAREKAARNERTLESQEDALQRLQRCHAEQLQKLAAAADARAQLWQQQKAEVEQHYSQLLADVNTRHKKTQVLADQAWEKVRVTGTLQQGLESECINLHRQLSQYQHEHDTLLAACSLLCGALYPLSSRCSALVAQRNQLMEQLHMFDAFKHDVVMLTDALSLLDSDAQMPAPPGNTEALLTKRREVGDNHKPGRRALLNFRRAVIAVMAANRLAFLRHDHCHMFVAHNVVPGLDSAVVCAGGVKTTRREFSGVSSPWLLENEKSLRRGEEYALSWLTSNQLLSTILATVGDLQGVLQKAQEGEGFDTVKIVSAAQNSFQNLISHLPSMFPGIAMDTHAGLRERGSLIRFLGHGLSRVTAQQGTLKPTHGGATWQVNSQVILSQLRQRVLELTERLHSAEVERRDLRAELGRTTRDKRSLTEMSRKAQLLQHQLASLQNQQDNCVAQDKFDGICQELNNALDRERQAEAILNEQSQRLTELNVQLDLQVAHFVEQEQKFHGATKDLSDTKTQLRHQQQVARQLNRQLSQYECDCKLLRENVKDAENALRTAVR